MINNEMRKENEQDQIFIPRLLSAKDVAQILGISAKTVNRLVREGKLACVQVYDQGAEIYGRAGEGVHRGQVEGSTR